MEQVRRDKTGSMFAFGLIALGIIVLLANTGLVSIGSWFSFQYWPFMLVALGAVLLVARKGRAMMLLAILGLGGAFYLLQPFTANSQTVLSASQNHTISQPLEGAKELKVNLSPSIAALSIQPSELTNTVIQGTVSTREGEKLKAEYTVQDNGSAKYLLESKSENRFGNLLKNERSWDLSLNTRVPLDLRVDAGIGELDLNLAGFNLTDLEVSAGVGEADITLPAQGSFHADIDSGVGAITVRIPKDLAVRISIDRGIGSVDMDAYFDKRGDTYYSPNFDSSSQKVDLDINAGIGAIEIRSF